MLSRSEPSLKRLMRQVRGAWPRLVCLALIVQWSAPSRSEAATLAAFPGAEGAGASALGGRGGDVYYVTNLNDNGAGSLRNGISSATGPRTILFKVSGNIVLSSTLTVNKSRITIAGQTAPGDGVCVQNYSFNIGANDVVVRHLRTRLGTNALQEADSMWINAGSNIVVDHVSASWSVDETLSSSATAANVSVQWCYITESLNNSIHSKGQHGYGSLVTPGVNTTYSWHHNLYAHHHSRNPRPGTDNGAIVIFDFRNNLLYNWGDKAGYGSDWDPDPENLRMNYVANYLVAGLDSQETHAYQGGGTNTVIYQSGNVIDLNLNSQFDGVNNGWSMFSGSYVPTNTPFAAPGVATDSAPVALQRVLAQGGAMPWRRDPADRRVTASVRNHVSRIINATPQVGGWPMLGSATPPTDTDSDGMPDFWETALGLNPANASDRNNTAASGYTQLEEYLNWLAEPHAMGDRNARFDVNLPQLVGGASNLVFSVADGPSGSVALRPDGYTARFTPAVDFFGRTSFFFTAADPASGTSFGPVTVGVLITTNTVPNTPPRFAFATNQSTLAGAALSFACSATDTDTPPQQLAFTLINAPAAAGMNSTNGMFSWRPIIALSGTTNTLQAVVSDDGLPSLSATQAFRVVVLRPAAPALQPAVSSNGHFSLTVSGDAGPDYLVQASTNLAASPNWTTVFTINSPALPFRWSDTNAGNLRQRFYRVLLGP